MKLFTEVSVVIGLCFRVFYFVITKLFRNRNNIILQINIKKTVGRKTNYYFKIKNEKIITFFSEMLLHIL